MTIEEYRADVKTMLTYLRTVFHDDTLRTQDRVAAVAAYLEHGWQLQQAVYDEDDSTESLTLGGIDPAQQTVS